MTTDPDQPSRPNKVRWHITAHAVDRMAERFPERLSGHALNALELGDFYPARAEMETTVQHAVYDKCLSSHPHHREVDRRLGRSQRFYYLRGEIVFLGNLSRFQKWDIAVVTILTLKSVRQNLELREREPLELPRSFTPHQYAMIQAKRRFREFRQGLRQSLKLGYNNSTTIKDQPS